MMKSRDSRRTTARTILFIIVLLLTPAGNLQAQERNFTLNLGRILFSEAADTISKLIPVKIYYSDKWVDSLYLDFDGIESSDNQLIERLTGGAGFSWFVSDEGKVVITGGYKVKQDFGKEYIDFITKRESVLIYNDNPGFFLDSDNSPLEEELKLFRIGNQSEKGRDGIVSLSGYVYDGVSEEAVPGATVFIDKLKVGAVTNSAGFYRLNVPRGQYQIEYRLIGMRNTYRNVLVFSSGTLDVRMFEKTNQLNEVTVIATRATNILNKGMGVNKIDVKNMRKIPLGLGEVDLVKSTLLLPGIQTAGEASAGFNVRGGAVDQNLFMIDYAPIVNANHFFGFFSAVNTDIIDDITLYKGSVPAKFGGRIASVMDVAYKKPDRDKVKVSGGLSPVMGRIVAETPIVSDKSSMILSARTTYSNWILNQLSDLRLRKSSAGFTDFQGMVDYQAGGKDYFTVSGYYSNDMFDYYKQTSFNYSNKASTFKWQHNFSNSLSTEIIALYSGYDYSMSTGTDSITYGELSYNLNQKILRIDNRWAPDEKSKIEFGTEVSLIDLKAGKINPLGEWSQVVPEDLGTEQGYDLVLYAGDEIRINEKLTFNAGLRFSMFAYAGPRNIYIYNEGVPRNITETSDTVEYGKGEIIGRYPSLDYRFSARYVAWPGVAVKAGIHRMTQNLHMISNTTSMSPTDIWKLSDTYLKPRYSDQISLGIYKTLGNLKMEASVEGYYKFLTNVMDYKGGSELLMNGHLETDLLSGKGKAYGIEFLLEKNSGILTGMFSYTYSRVFHKIDGEALEEKINGGEYFRANTDKPNDIKFFSNFKFSRRMNLTTNFTYNTGRPITYPIGFYYFKGSYMLLYSERNAYRLPDYARLDLALTINGNLRLKKLNHSSFTFSVYNVLGRRNPYSIFFRTENGQVEGYKMSIFGQQVFTVSYNFRILGNALGDF